MRMTDGDVKLRHVAAFPFEESGRIFVGARRAFDGVLGEDECPPNELDDEILVTQRGGNCFVTGSNGRSVLFAAYSLLERLGARWPGPGHLGEVLDQGDCSALFKQEIAERASYRHRGVCIEGAPSLEHALAMVDWMAKHKMNTFFLQFKTSIWFWRNYYSREYNPSYGKREDIDEERSMELDDEVIRAAKLRGMVIHRVGHGWTAESIGFPGLGWYKAEREPDEDTRKLLALVNGKRGFFGNTPINTELCYSNPDAFNGVVEEVVAYAKEHPEVDCLHFWLSDATNNFCECENCRKRSPSDWYAMLVRKVAERLKAAGLPTRVVFLCYTNTLTAPREQTLPQEGLVYMFAPISRCYVHALADPSCSGGGKAGGWPLNRVEPPRTNAEYVTIRRAWKRAFSGDSFVFEYYLWRPYLRSQSPLAFAKLINEDVRNLKDLDLNGMVSCQVLRSFYPAGLQMLSMAATLWDVRTDLDSLVEEQLRLCFGNNRETVKEYLARIDELLRPVEAHPHRPALDAGDLERAERLAAITDEFSAKMSSLEAANDREGRYLDLLGHFNKVLNMRSRAASLVARGREKEAEKLWERISQFVRETEGLTHRYLDSWLLLRTIRG